MRVVDAVDVVGARAGSLDLFLAMDVAACPPRTRRATLVARLREAVMSGRLRAGTVLPSTRVLARELGLARGTVVDAYDELAAHGYVRTRPGGETTVAADRSGLGASSWAGKGDVQFPPVDLRAGAADLTSFPSGQWVGALRAALATTPGARLDYPPPAGTEELRSVLADYLARSRGVAATVDRIVVCGGVTHALALLTDALCSLGRGRIAIDDPCVPRHRAVIAAHGGDVVGVPVDDDGVSVDAVIAADPDAVILAPVHQYPMGVALSPERRQRLLAWARQRGRLLVEDDYDAEFRYERRALGALQGEDPDRVAYAGTLSKTLAAGLRLGWLVLPECLVGPVVAAKHWAGADNSVLDQLAFAELVTSGRYDRHVRRMRGIFRRRRDRFLAALDAAAPHLPAKRIAAGLHFVVELPEGGPAEGDVLRAARHAGVSLFGLRRCWHGDARSQGVIVGFGRPPEHAIDGAIRGLVHVLDMASRADQADVEAEADAGRDRIDRCRRAAFVFNPCPLYDDLS